jgi:hypothetical protein
MGTFSQQNVSIQGALQLTMQTENVLAVAKFEKFPQ